MSFKNDLCCQTSYYKLKDVKDETEKKSKYAKEIEKNILEIKNLMVKEEKINENEFLELELNKLQDKHNAVIGTLNYIKYSFIVHKNSNEQMFLEKFKDSLKRSEVPVLKKVFTNITKNTILLKPKKRKMDEETFNRENPQTTKNITNDLSFIEQIDNKLNKIKDQYFDKVEKKNSIEDKLSCDQIALYSMINKLSKTIPPNIGKLFLNLN